MSVSKAKILIFTVCAFLSILLQTDLWPFSHFPMFNSNTENSTIKGLPSYTLEGVAKSGETRVIRDRKSLGGVHPSSLQSILHRLEQGSDSQCLNETAAYWSHRIAVASTKQNFAPEKIRLVRWTDARSTVLTERSIHEKMD